MKVRVGLLTLMLVLSFLRPVTVLAQGTAFTYQGQLLTTNGPAHGLYNVEFSLYTAQSPGGVQVGSTITTNGIVVTNGLFTVTVDFGAGIFNGTPYWLQIGVETNGGGSFTVLSLRQELTPAPYSIYSEGANAAGLTGTVPAGVVPDSSLPPDVALTDATQTFTGVNSFSNNISLLNPSSTIIFPATSGANSPMMAMFSSGTANADRMVIAHSLFFPNWGLQYQDSTDKFNFLSAGTPVLTVNLGSQSVYAIGNVGIGTANPAQQELSVHGGLNIDQANLNAGFLNNGSNNSFGLSFGSSSGEGIASERTSGANQYGLDFYTSFTQRMSLNNGGNLMLNSNDVYLLGATSSSPGGTGTYGLGYRTSVAGISPSGGDGPFLFGFDAGYLGTRSPDAIALWWDWHGNVWVSNNCSVASLTIRGGADLAEPFRISSREKEIPKGSVMVIDEANPGQLKVSDRPYDTRVAGVLSGANGVNPGIQMQQQGLIEGDRNVALSGRVYVLADTANGTIKPGDLLTTSATPGYAMKVTDHGKAEGAILGKAMTSLSQGKGMVLVLVTLQ